MSEGLAKIEQVRNILRSHGVSVDNETIATEILAALNPEGNDHACGLPMVTVRDHCTSPKHGLDRVRLSIQHGPLGSFDRVDGELLARLWNEFRARANTGEGQ